MSYIIVNLGSVTSTARVLRLTVLSRPPDLCAHASTDNMRAHAFDAHAHHVMIVDVVLVAVVGELK